MRGSEEANDTHGLIIQMFSVHGLIRGRDLELGRDADTGGQTKYVVELARALGRCEEVEQVDLFTRLIDDPRLSDDYATPLEELGPHARLVRIKAGGTRYRRKELLWPLLDEFVEGVLRFNRERGISPHVVHGHYADAGYVALQLASVLGVPLIFTGHSLGRNKLRVLSRAGMSEEEIDRQYHINHRIAVEEEVLEKADLVIASTNHEVHRGYELYEATPNANYTVIPPGIEVGKFYPFYYDLDEAFDPGEEVVRARVRQRQEIARFLYDPNKPLILAISRPDRRKNIDGLLTAYGEDKELQQIANLAIFAGVRKDITQMDDNEQEVLTRMLLLMDRYDLYGRLALPKKHDPDTDIPVLYRLAAASRGVFINPALVENFGITLIEASSSGLPVVSTDHGGPQDIIANCRSGILVDASDTSAIQEALKRVLVNHDEWDGYSENGIEGVRRHYAWEAHAESYLREIGTLRGRLDELRRAPWRTGAGQHLHRGRRLLVSDIDHTLIDEDGGDDVEGLRALGEALRQGGLAFAVASGRNLEQVRDALASHAIPDPEVLICAVGSEIYYGPKAVQDLGYAHYLAHGWRPEGVREALSGLEFLEPQPEHAQRPFKVSYYLRAGGDEAAERLEEVRRALSQAGVQATVVHSGGAFLDLLPSRASKGKAIRYLARKWGLSPRDVAVAGDSGNDTEMLAARFSGIVVGNHAPELAELRGRRGIYFADAALARGVLEGLRHYGFVGDAAAVDEREGSAPA
ncbi:MAG TPA: HAD-IIB family hydrolase [Trueperaceae bacterium]|nr:HAD-IIB family hydrolase [Trueperaceae bacterium]